VSPACAINYVAENFSNVRDDPSKAVRRSYSAWRLLFWEPNKHSSSELWFAGLDHLDTMRIDKLDKAPTTNFETSGRAKKLKAVCLQAGFAIAVLIAMAGWLYFLAGLGLSFATWIFG
jgi:hypothetical protein